MAQPEKKQDTKQEIRIVPTLMSLPRSLQSLSERLDFFNYRIEDMKLDETGANGSQSAPDLVLVPFTNRVQLLELSKKIKAFQKSFPNCRTQIFGLYSGALPFKVNDLYMIGFHGTFQFPLEEELLINKIFELMPVYKLASELSADDLVRVHIIEIEGIKVLPFDLFVFLPMNNKAILYMEKNCVMDAKQIQKFKENSHYALYVRRSDIKAYRDLARDQLKSVNQLPGLSALEKSKEVGRRLSGLMGSFFGGDDFNEDEGKQLQTNLNAIVGEMDTPSQDITRFTGERMTMASHGQNASVYCYMFGMAMGLTDGQSLRLGGLLHDIGITELPTDIQKGLPDKLDKDQSAKFKIHPLLGKAALEKKKMQVSSDVMDMISFHHEHTDGTGYPTKKKGSDIPLYAKACAFANEFDKLTSLRPGRPQFSPREAILRIAGMNGMPASPIYDHVVHHRILEVFLGKEVANPKPRSAASTEDSMMAAGSAGSPGSHGSISSVSSSGKKSAKISLERLLKTDAFRAPGFIPDHKPVDNEDQQLFENLSNQLKEHFKQKFS